MNLAALQARLKELTGELDALLTKDTVPEADQGAHFDAIEAKAAEMETLEKQIETLQKAEAIKAKAAKPAEAPLVEERNAPAQVLKDLTTVEKVGVMVFSMAKTYREEGNRGAKATFKAMEDAGYGAVAREFAGAQQRALNSGSAAAGGILVPEEMSSEIIDILRPRTTFLQGNPRRVSLASGSYKLPAAATGATATWRGEGKPIQVSQPTFKDINLTAKFLDAMVPLTNQLLRWSLADVRSWVERDMALEMGTKLDYAAYFGSGGAHTPTGITKVEGITRFSGANGTAPSVVDIEASARTAELSMEGRNLPMTNAVWVMAPRVRKFLGDLRDGNGNRYYPELHSAAPVWRGYPVYSTTQVPVNGGGTTDESEILLVNFDDVFFGEGAGLSFGVSTEATYVNNGQTVSAFQNDLTIIKASLEADVDLRYLEAVAVIDGVRWGA